MDSPGQADAWHAAGVANGGTACEEAPGVRNGARAPLLHQLDLGDERARAGLRRPSLEEPQERGVELLDGGQVPGLVEELGEAGKKVHTGRRRVAFADVISESWGWSLVRSGIITGAIVTLISFIAFYFTDETYHKDLNYTEQ